MTTDATFIAVDVVKGSRQPQVAAMAFVAGDFSGNMGDVFSGCGKPVMAALATTERLAVVESGQRLPRGFQVAILALAGSLYVVQRQRCRLHQSATVVTTGAFPGRSVKYASYVTGRTAH